ncbi:hypothetical protein TNCV_2859511 [Trichonephila clavipes]|nr:hypothetical protein TNCV_2859511 [Trichonephila clavipes]
MLIVSPESHSILNYLKSKGRVPAGLVQLESRTHRPMREVLNFSGLIALALLIANYPLSNDVEEVHSRWNDGQVQKASQL